MRKILLLSVISAGLMIVGGCAKPELVKIDFKQFDKVTGAQALGHYDNKSDIDKAMAQIKNREGVIQTFSPPTQQVPIKLGEKTKNLRASCDLWRTITSIYIPSSVLNANKNGASDEVLQLWVCYTKDDVINNYSWKHLYNFVNGSGGQVTIAEEDMNKMPDAYVKYQKIIDYMVSRKHQLLTQGS